LVSVICDLDFEGSLGALFSGLICLSIAWTSELIEEGAWSNALMH